MPDKALSAEDIDQWLKEELFVLLKDRKKPIKPIRDTDHLMNDLNLSEADLNELLRNLHRRMTLNGMTAPKTPGIPATVGDLCRILRLYIAQTGLDPESLETFQESRKRTRLRQFGRRVST